MVKFKIIAAIIIFILVANISPANSKTYYKEIKLPYEEKNQPIDLHVEFDNPCYAVNEKDNSIRVFYNGNEIESDIYNLNYIDKSHIKSCNVVFLSQGKGTYIIKYGDEGEKKNYKNHVDVVDSHYYYQLFPGYYAKLDYYAIMQDGKCVFSIGQQGNVLGIQMGQKVIKMKENATQFKFSTWEEMSSFSFFYYEGKEVGTDEKLISKKIIFDGNLIAKVMIESMSSNGKVKTRAYYTYYYTPSTNKRIFIKFSHNALQNCNVYGIDEENGIFAYLMCIKSRSNAINELNMGEILPYIHLYGENGIEEYKMDTNPQNKNYRWLISSKDDVLLGEKPWVCMDDGKAYGMIFNKNASGLEIKAVVEKKFDLPGLTVAGGGVSVGRRGKGGSIPKGFKASYKCEMYYGKNLEDMENEANGFYNFSKYREESIENVKMHKLKVVIHSILPFRTRVEAWNGRNMVASSDSWLRRASLELPEGNYTIRVYTKFGAYIGEKFVNLNEDKKIHIFCTFEGKLHLEMNDGFEARLIDNKNGIVYENISSNGYTELFAPAFHKYKLQIVYKGFLMEEKSIFIPSRSMKFNFNLYNLNVEIKDALNLPVEVNLSISLTSNEMIEKMNLYPEKEKNLYQFKNLPSGNYILKINFKEFKLNKNIKIPEEENLKINFPVVYKINVNAYDDRGFKIKAKIKFERNGMEFERDELPPGKYNVNVYYKNKKIASMGTYISSTDMIDIVTKKNSIYIYGIIAAISIIIGYFIYKRRFFNALLGMFLFSILLPWWGIASDKKTNLYLLPPSMIEMGSNYGKIISIPSVFKYAFILSLLLFIISIALSLIKKFKHSSATSISSLIIFLSFLYAFSKISVGSIWGNGSINGSNATWGAGTGFYIALVFAILNIAVVINEIRRRG